MDIERVLTISTAHISEATAELLSIEPETDMIGISVYCKADYGWFIYIPNGLIEHYNGGHDVPEDLWRCMCLAYDNSCNWLCLDCDGDEVEELKTYDW